MLCRRTEKGSARKGAGDGSKGKGGALLEGLRLLKISCGLRITTGGSKGLWRGQILFCKAFTDAKEEIAAPNIHRRGKA